MPRALNNTAASLLGFLHDGPMTGWDLMRVAEVRIGEFWSLTRSQVYRELTAMEGEGLVVAGEPGPRDRRPYALTDAGRAAFAEWLRKEPGPENIRFPLLLTVGFGRHLEPGMLAGMLARHRAVHEARLASYLAQEASPGDGDGDGDGGGEQGSGDRRGHDPYVAATLAFGIAYERAVLAWFDDLPPELTG